MTNITIDNNDKHYSINRLQKIQNSVARIVTRTSRSSHITPVLKLYIGYQFNDKHYY